MTKRREGKSDIALYARMLGFAGPYLWHIVGVFILGMLSAPFALLKPIPLAIVVDYVVGDASPPRAIMWFLGPDPGSMAILVFAAALLVTVNLVKNLVALGRRLLHAYTGEHLIISLRRRLFRQAQRLSLLYHDRRGSADSIYRIQSDAKAVQAIALEGVAPFLTALVTASSMLFVTARIDVRLALIAAAVAPATVVLTQIYKRRMRIEWRQVKEKETGALGVVQEVLTSLRLVKAFGQEDHEEERYIDVAADGLRSKLRAVTTTSFFALVLGLTTVIGTALVLFVGARSVLAGQITLGSLLLVVSYLGQIYGPMETMGNKLATLQGSFASAERAFALLDEPPDVADPPNGRRIQRARGEIEFDDVSVRYEEGSLVLKEVSFRIDALSRVGIAGQTGAGKTTLVNLVARLIDPNEGVIRLDGIDLREYDLADLRGQYSIVTQEPILFSTSIAENIEYGRPGATDTEVIEAATAASIHEVISALPDGYSTVVGERGMRLSGGERQRISLARAFLKDAPILVLDEPTSSVDLATEADIVAALERLMRDRTTFMVAHRLTTLQGCDVLLYLQDGRVTVVEQAVDAVLETARRRNDLGSAIRGLA